jgi:hypothetical protein
MGMEMLSQKAVPQSLSHFSKKTNTGVEQFKMVRNPTKPMTNQILLAALWAFGFGAKS